MKKLFILLLFLSFNCESIASHNKFEDPDFHDYEAHFLWNHSNSKVRQKALLDLAEKENFHAQTEVLFGYFHQGDPSYMSYPEISYSETVSLYKKILENECGWIKITIGITLLDEKRPKDHGVDEKSLDITLYAVASLKYEYFSAYIYRDNLNLMPETLERMYNHYKGFILKVKKRLNESDIKEAYKYANYLRSKWPFWNSLYNPNLNLLNDLHDSYLYSCLSLGEEEYQTEALKLYKKHLGIKD